MEPKAEKTKTLTLTEKQKHPSGGSHDIAQKFGVGRTQIQNILEWKAEIKSDSKK